MQDYLREEVKKIKLYRNIPYCYFAEQLKIHRNSFYNFMKGYYNLSADKIEALQSIIENLKQ